MSLNALHSATAGKDNKILVMKAVADSLSIYTEGKAEGKQQRNRSGISIELW